MFKFLFSRKLKRKKTNKQYLLCSISTYVVLQIQENYFSDRLNLFQNKLLLYYKKSIIKISAFTLVNIIGELLV